MKIIHRYVLGQILRNLFAILLVFTLLFLVFDFFDRIDNILPEGSSLPTVISYFLFKIPFTVSVMLPVAMLVATMLTIGLLSRNSEITAMRASGLKVIWIARPIFWVGLALSLVSLVLNETIVPYSTRRVKEIYNIDIRQKDKRGGYSQADFWWRRGRQFYAVDSFDSRTNTLYALIQLELDDEFKIASRTDAARAVYLDPLLGWNMQQLQVYHFTPKGEEVQEYAGLPLPIPETPEDFYDVKPDPFSLNFFELQRFIREQTANGIRADGYLAVLHAKIAFPFITLIVVIVSLPFALKPARTGSMAGSFLAGLVIAFTYYAVHSVAISFGRAELWNPVAAAWTANFLMGFVGVVLNLGSEAP